MEVLGNLYFMKLYNNRIYFEWDIFTWARSRNVWDKILYDYKSKENTLALEIGGRHGGLSLYLASEFKINVICSDLSDIFLTNAKHLHINKGVENFVSYREIDVLKIDIPDNSVDIVIFKSVIGALGNKENQQQAINEIFRILKPNGKFFFAENIRATSFHMFLRGVFTSHTKNGWHYPSYQDFFEYLSSFRFVNIDSTGFIALFARNYVLNFLLSQFDLLLSFIPKKNRYVIYGCCSK